MMETIMLCNDELKRELFKNVKYFMIAEGGAMGTPGEIHFLTADQKQYSMNYVYGDIDLNKLSKVFPVMKECNFGMFGAGSIVPDGWRYVYLGMGNHLLVESSIFGQFAARVKNLEDPAYVFQTWYGAAVDTLSQEMQTSKGSEYETTEYIINEDNSVRFVLGKYNRDPLIVFGINPSTASAEKNDTTISIVEKIARMRRKDGYVMLNIYPYRATNIDEKYPTEADEKLVRQNLQYISERIKPGDEVIAAWGTHICDHDYFVKSLVQINEVVREKSAKWICLKRTTSGHPHHPTRLAYDRMEFMPFDMDSYIEAMQRKIKKR